MPRVVVLDYGSGNLRSAQRALARAGADVVVTADASLALSCDGLVVPGVGAFAACMAGLLDVRGDELIGKRVSLGRPVLGICVGMQVLFGAGVEHGVLTPGCGVWPGVVERLDTGSLPLPHMGWNTVSVPDESMLFRGLGPETRFYFVHSYAVRAASVSSVVSSSSGSTVSGGSGGGLPGAVSWAWHGENFVAAVEDGVVSATQFHPEKSGDAGFAVLSNWLGSLG